MLCPRIFMRHFGVLFIILSLPIFVVAQPNGTLILSITVDGQPGDALIRVIQNGKTFTLEYTDVHALGRAQFALPPGNYTLQIEHGAGFISTPTVLDLSVAAGATQERSVSIASRLIPQELGYYSADLHAHTIGSAAAHERIFGIPNHGVTPIDQAVGVQLAAGLDLMFISDHNSVDGHELFAQTSQERGVPYLLSEEVTTIKWGHYNPIALEPGRLVEFGFSKTPTQYFNEARANGAALIQVNHPLDPIDGYFFSQSQPEYDPNFDAVEVFNGSFEEPDLQTILRLFNYWNEGKRLIATAVSDDHDWKGQGTEYGTPRTYVFIDGPLTAEKFLTALQGAHAFVTYGPLLIAKANDSAIPGDTLKLRPTEKISLKFDLLSVSVLDEMRLDVIRNGQRVASFEPEGEQATFTFEDVPSGNGWYIARLIGASGKYRAMTNPIWVELGQ